MFLKDDGRSGQLSPDTEDNVADQTDGVFRNFVYHMTVMRNGVSGADDAPDLPELTAFADNPYSPVAQIGRQLAVVGDDINNRYAPEFSQMIRMLRLTPETAYEAFAGVAHKLFRDGHVSWGRIVTLLCFGYRMAVTVIQRGIRGFFSQIVGFVVRFVLSEKIAKWIAEQGGWRAALRYIPETVGWTTMGAILTMAAVSVAAAMFITRKS
jgi:Bcl-2 antagonist/killer family protein